VTLKRIVLTVFISTMASSCAIFSSSDDFSVSGTITQTITIEKSRPVTIRCYCKKRTLKTNSTENTLELKITGTHGSGGYHGEQDKPETISPNLLRFVEKRTNEGLTLISHEYTYIHHAYIVNKLEISAPLGAKINIQSVSREDLVGRTVE